MDTNEGIGKYVMPIAVLIGAVVIAGAFALGRGAFPAPSGSQTVPVDIADVKTETSPSAGLATAPVTMAVWFDYQCPHCQRFELDTMPQVFANYVDAGKVRVIYKDFQFLGADSETAALFARAVYEAYPASFPAWFTAVMDKQANDQAFGSQQTLTALTRTILAAQDADAVVALMNQKKGQYQAAIAADRDEGGSFGITGTPAIMIGTTLLSGAYPYAEVAKLLDAELAR